MTSCKIRDSMEALIADQACASICRALRQEMEAYLNASSAARTLENMLAAAAGHSA